MRRYLAQAPLVLALIALWTFPSSAQPTTPEEHLDGMVLAFQAGCTVDTEGDTRGFCELYYDAEGLAWLVFYDRPGHILWIRTGERGTEYHYLYRAVAGQPV